MIYDGNWALAQAMKYGMYINFAMGTIKCPGHTRYWTWNSIDTAGLIEAMVEAVAYVEERRT